MNRKVIVNDSYDKYVAPLGAWGMFRFFIACKLGTLAMWIGGEPYQFFTISIIKKYAEEI